MTRFVLLHFGYGVRRHLLHEGYIILGHGVDVDWGLCRLSPLLVSFYKNLSDFCLLIVKVYPIGIPVLYSGLLWRKRHLLNPRAVSVGKCESYDASEGVSGDGVGKWNSSQSSIF